MTLRAEYGLVLGSMWLGAADRRARAVRDWLIKMGHIPGERLFLPTPDIGKAEGKADGTSLSKVKFKLK